MIIIIHFYNYYSLQLSTGTLSVDILVSEAVEEEAEESKPPSAMMFSAASKIDLGNQVPDDL